MYCKALLSGMVALAVLHVGRGSDLNVTLGYDSTTVAVDGPFNFNCSAKGVTETVNFSILFFNNPSNDADDRLTCVPVLENTANCSLNPLLSTDNGIGIMCEGNVRDKSGNSSIVPLNVLFPPTFEEGQGLTLAMINESSNYTLNFRIIAGNPNAREVKLSTNAPAQDNVQIITNNETVSKFEITGAVRNNVGNYSATVNNSFGSTTLTYSVFVGGPLNASKFTISCNQSTNRNDLLFISCNVADGNSAPALAMDFRMPGLNIGQTFYFPANEIPVHRNFSPLFNTSLEHVFAGNYDLEIVATNGLSPAPVNIYSQAFYVAGLERVAIKPNSSIYQTLGSGKNFTFSCAVMNQTVASANITLLIDGSDNDTKLRKVSNKTTGTEIAFTYLIDSYTDDQTVFSCRYTNNNIVGLSPNLTLTVFYGPQYTLVNMSDLYGVNGTEMNLNVGLMANPPVDKNFTWMLNGKKISDSSNVKVTPGELQFSPLLLNSEGNYSVEDCNNITCGTIHFEFAVYFTPLFVGEVRNLSLLTEIATKNDANLTCTVAEYKGPEALNLTVTASPSVPDLRTRKTNDSSVTVIITNASSGEPNPVAYTCHACYGDRLCSYLSYPTYVGGAPNNVTLRGLNVSGVESSGDEYSLTLVANLTDYSQVPVTGLKYTVRKTNVSRNVPVQAPMTGIPQPVNSTQSLKQTELGGGPTFDLDIYAVNDLGSLSVTVVKVTVPVASTTLIPPSSPTTPTTSPPSSPTSRPTSTSPTSRSTSTSPTTSPTSSPAPVKNNGAIIAVAILVPLAVIVVITVAVAGGYYYYYKKYRHPKTYERVSTDNADVDDASGGL